LQKFSQGFYSKDNSLKLNLCFFLVGSAELPPLKEFESFRFFKNLFMDGLVVERQSEGGL